MSGDHRILCALCDEVGLPHPEAEWEFTPHRKFRADFAWPENDPPLALEVDGGVWTGGRHTRSTGFLRDHEKRNEYATQGWRVIYTTPDKLYTMETIDLIRRALLG